MRDLNEHSITDAVLEKVTNGACERANRISAALVRHLHAFVKEIEPSEEEWGEAIAFLTRTGQLCTNSRQEFILLSDTLGVSMLVDAINHRSTDGATETTVFGPFFVADAPEVDHGTDISGHLGGSPLLIAGSVSATDGTPIAGAIVDIWHADENGFYDVQLGETLGGRGRVRTNADGRFHVRSIVPVPYPIPDDGTVGDMLKAQGRHPYRPAHVHFMVTAPGYRRLVTHYFLEGSDYLDSDVVFGVKRSLIHQLQPPEDSEDERSYLLRADISLSRE